MSMKEEATSGIVPSSETDARLLKPPPQTLSLTSSLAEVAAAARWLDPPQDARWATATFLKPPNDAR